MMKAAGVAGLVALGTAAHAHDPVHTDGDKYKMKIENARVRVLEYKDQPRQKTHQHSHPAFVLVALSSFGTPIFLARTLPSSTVTPRYALAAPSLVAKNTPGEGPTAMATPILPVGASSFFAAASSACAQGIPKRHGHAGTEDRGQSHASPSKI